MLGASIPIEHCLIPLSPDHPLYQKHRGTGPVRVKAQNRPRRPTSPVLRKRCGLPLNLGKEKAGLPLLMRKGENKGDRRNKGHDSIQE